MNMSFFGGGHFNKIKKVISTKFLNDLLLLIAVCHRKVIWATTIRMHFCKIKFDFNQVELRGLIHMKDLKLGFYLSFTHCESGYNGPASPWSQLNLVEFCKMTKDLLMVAFVEWIIH